MSIASAMGFTLAMLVLAASPGPGEMATVTPVAFVTIAVMVSAVLSGVLGTYALLASRARMWFTIVPAMWRLNRTAGVVIATRS